MREEELYPCVERWAKRHFGCFRTATNTGIRNARLDVVGVRDVGGDLSGEVEVIAIEVKGGNCPFAAASGQTFGYTVCANRVYLADYRHSAFAPDEIQVASHLGIGLVRMWKNKCEEVLSSPVHHPITKLQMMLLERLRLGKCQLCGCFFSIGDGHGNWTATTTSLLRAIDGVKGFRFWNFSVGKRKLGDRSYETYERRYICPGCMESVFSKVAELANKPSV